jgi:kumamolisin
MNSVIGTEEIAMDGTSAAIPLWAALIAIANAERGAPLGLVAPHLYANSASMRPIVIGNNRQNGIGYATGTGWSACTGLGVPRGAAIVDALASIPMA